MEITIKKLADKFHNQINKSITEEDCELYKMILKDHHDQIHILTGEKFVYLETVLNSIDLLKYNDGKGMKDLFFNAILNLGVFCKWAQDIADKFKRTSTNE
jgi:hypothetical protein